MLTDLDGFRVPGRDRAKWLSRSDCRDSVTTIGERNVASGGRTAVPVRRRTGRKLGAPAITRQRPELYRLCLCHLREAHASHRDDSGASMGPGRKRPANCCRKSRLPMARSSCERAGSSRTRVSTSRRASEFRTNLGSADTRVSFFRNSETGTGKVRFFVVKMRRNGLKIEINCEILPLIMRLT